MLKRAENVFEQIASRFVIQTSPRHSADQCWDEQVSRSDEEGFGREVHRYFSHPWACFACLVSPDLADPNAVYILRDPAPHLRLYTAMLF